ncbi:hypothetical protein DEO72_LG1g2261 [Vigna unguiculata]|uniref:Uncharacterized protein n=1 Tax=Vigna unguiculata TaxID=3917 RepID=A0A4D6KPW0_VIGUN|nr:hypothetical protein DEO72_LG1g2261 [Vigna unguiculata]
MVAARCVEALQLRTEMVAHGGARLVNGAGTARFRCVKVDEIMEVVGAVEMEKRDDDGARCLMVVENAAAAVERHGGG